MKKLTNTFLCTDGSGLWSEKKSVVKIVGLEVSYDEQEPDFGELRVYFDTRTWDVSTDGLIYTDRNFLSGLIMTLNDLGFCGSDISYSEQGMQGPDYVSLDIGEEFIRSWINETVDH